LLWALRGLRRETSRDRLLLRLGAAKSKAGRAASLVEINLPAAAPTGQKKKSEKLTAGSFTSGSRRKRFKEAELYDGHYLLRRQPE